jgi:hypothetical protein
MGDYDPRQGGGLYRVTDQVPCYAPGAMTRYATHTYRSDEPRLQTFPVPVHMNSAAADAAEDAVREQYPREWATAAERKAQALRTDVEAGSIAARKRARELRATAESLLATAARRRSASDRARAADSAEERVRARALEREATALEDRALELNLEALRLETGARDMLVAERGAHAAGDVARATALTALSRTLRTEADEARAEADSTLEAARAEQRAWLERSVRRRVAEEATTRQLLLNKADALVELGRVEEARIIRESLYRTEQRGDVVE